MFFLDIRLIKNELDIFINNYINIQTFQYNALIKKFLLDCLRKVFSKLSFLKKSQLIYKYLTLVL